MLFCLIIHDVATVLLKSHWKLRSNQPYWTFVKWNECVTKALQCWMKNKVVIEGRGRL